MKMKFSLDMGAYAPRKAHQEDAGYDLMVNENDVIELRPYGNAIIDTGVHVEIPNGYRGSVVGRSGLNFKNGIICPTGTIDSGYTGPIKVKLYNMEEETYTFHGGNKIAQLIISPIADIELDHVGKLDDTERGDGGFGSTGK